jgi:hypothetical protein
MTPHRFLTLQDLVLPPPLPALVALLIAAGVAWLGWRLAVWLRRGQADELDAAAGFIVAAAAIAAAVHGLAMAQLSTIPVVRALGLGLGALGTYALVRHRRGIAGAVRRELAALWAGPPLERAGTVIATLALLGLAAAAFGPPTDADSFDYHLGVPLDWLRHGGAYPRLDWFTTRVVGIGESLNMLGLAAGTDSLGAAMQLGGLVAAALAVRAMASTPRERLLAWLLVVACPVVAFLVPNQKPQMLPTAATTVALVLAVRRFASFGTAEAVLALGCAAFAAASKISFVLTVGFVVLVCLLAARKSGRLLATLGVGVAAFAALILPVLWRKYLFFGDPLSPFLEKLRAHPDPAVIGYATYLRAAGGERTLPGLLRAGLGMLGTTHPGDFTATLGLGALAIVPALFARGPARLLLATALACGAVSAALGQLGARFFLEHYFWIGAAAVGARWTRPKHLLLGAVTLQGVASAAVALFGAATLFPGALTPGLRERVMSRATAGYDEARWLDRVLPEDTVFTGQGRFRALAPRPFVAGDAIMTDDAQRVDERSLARLVVASGVNTLVLESSMEPAFARLAQRCGEPMSAPTRFTLATRNPWNRQQYSIQLYRLRGCERVAAP